MISAPTAGAQEPESVTGSGIAVSAVPRWGRSTPGAWTAYLVTVRNQSGSDFNGEVVLVATVVPAPDANRPPENDPEPPPERVLALGEREMTLPLAAAPDRPPSDFPFHRAPLAVPGNSTRASTMVVVEAPFGYQAEVRDRSGATVAVSDPVPGAQPYFTVAVLGADAGTQDAFARLGDFFPRSSTNQAGSLAVTTVAKPDDFPDSVLALSGLDAIAMADFDIASLTPGQVRALRDFVALGGSLILRGGLVGTRTVSTLPDELVPLRPSGSAVVSLSSLKGLVDRATAATAPVLTGELRRGRVILDSDGGVPLVVQAEHRGGRVVQLAYDPLEEPFTSDVELRDLAWQQGIGRALYGFVRGSDGAAVPTVAPFGQLWSAAPNLGGWEPWPRSALWLLAAYGLAVIPLGYWVLRAGRRLNRLWPAALGVAMLFALVVVRGGDSRVENRQPALKVTVVGPAGTAVTYSYQGEQAIGRGTRRFAVGDGAVSTLLSAPNLATGAPPGMLGTGGGDIEHGRATALTLPTEPGEVSRFEVMSVGEAAGLESQLRLVGFDPPEQGGLRVTGTITNRSKRTVRRVRVQLPEGAQAQVADMLAPGETLNVDASFVWPNSVAVDEGLDSPPEDLVMFAAADQAFTRAGQAVVVGLDGDSAAGGAGLAVVIEVVPLGGSEIPVAGAGPSHLVAAVPEGSAKTSVYELDGLAGLGPVDLIYSTYAPPPEIYDWTARTWRLLPPGNQSHGVSDASPLTPTEVGNGIVRVRAKSETRASGFGLNPHRSPVAARDRQ